MCDTMKAIIFDMDGVLIHSEHLHRQATTEALKLYGIERKKSMEIKMRGRALIDSMAAIVDYYKVQDDAMTFQNKRNEIFYKLLTENDIAMSGVLDFIKKLREKHVRIALGTSATRDFAEFSIKKLKLESILIILPKITKINNHKG